MIDYRGTTWLESSQNYTIQSFKKMNLLLGSRPSLCPVTLWLP